MSDQKVKKTRNRIPTSCECCRRKKLRCDRGLPCSNCAKSGIPDECKYTAHNSKASPGANSKVQLNNEVIRLKMKINQYEKIMKLKNIDPSEFNDLFMDVNSLSPDNSSGSSPAVDPIVSMTEKFDRLVFKENKILHAGTTSFVTFINADNQLHHIFRPYIEKHSANFEAFKGSQNVKAVDVMNTPGAFEPAWLSACSTTAVNTCDITNSAFTLPVHVSISEAKVITEMIAKINKIIPPMYVIHTLVDNFFKHVYPIFPYVNEEIFKEELDLILIPIEGGGARVELTHFQNASIVSLLLIILRFSYLTINIKDIKDNMKEYDNEILAILIKSGIRIEHTFVLYAKSLLMSLPSNDTIFRKVTLRNIQTLLYLRIYQMYSPELNEESAEHSITLSLLIQMCHIMGANLDPSKFTNFYKDNRVRTIWRRIYHKLLALDVTSGLSYATPLIIHESEWSTRLPKLEDDELQLVNDFKKNLPLDVPFDYIKKLVLENHINNNIELEYKFYQLAKEGLEVFQNFKDSSKKSKYIEIVNKFEDFLSNKIPSIYEILHNSESSHRVDMMFDLPKVKTLEIRLSMVTFIQTFYYLLYLNEVDSDVSDSNDVYKFALKATEHSMAIYKFAFDYAQYMNQSSKIHGHTPSYRLFKGFSHMLECYIFNISQTAYQRSNLWISSMFMRNSVDNSITLDNLMRDFGNSVDSAVVLKWFNADIRSAEPESHDVNFTGLTQQNKELMVLIFNYTKDLYLMLYHFKDEYFIAWRNSTLIQLLLNSFKSKDNESCKMFMNCDIINTPSEGISTTYPDSFTVQLATTATDTSTTTDTSNFKTCNSYSSNEVSPYSMESNSSKSNGNEHVDLANSFHTVNAYDDSLKGLFYKNVDTLVDDIFSGTAQRSDMINRFDLFDTRDFNSNDPLESFMNEFGTTASAEGPLIGQDHAQKEPDLLDKLSQQNNQPALATPRTEALLNSINPNTPTEGSQLLSDLGIPSL